jgi:hypothetical protein
MKSTRTALTVLFPKARAELLRSLFASPVKQRYVRELRAMTGLALSTVQHELRKLKAINAVTSWSNGYHRFYRVNLGHPLVSHLARVVEISARLRVDRSALKKPRTRLKRKRLKQMERRPLRSGPASWEIFQPKRN